MPHPTVTTPPKSPAHFARLGIGVRATVRLLCLLIGVVGLFLAPRTAGATETQARGAGMCDDAQSVYAPPPIFAAADDTVSACDAVEPGAAARHGTTSPKTSQDISAPDQSVTLIELRPLAGAALTARRPLPQAQQVVAEEHRDERRRPPQR